jgi:hypothetical protein
VVAVNTVQMRIKSEFEDAVGLLRPPRSQIRSHLVDESAARTLTHHFIFHLERCLVRLVGLVGLSELSEFESFLIFRL